MSMMIHIQRVGQNKSIFFMFSALQAVLYYPTHIPFRGYISYCKAIQYNMDIGYGEPRFPRTPPPYGVLYRINKEREPKIFTVI